jgi:hypothetical protein
MSKKTDKKSKKTDKKTVPLAPVLNNPNGQGSTGLVVSKNVSTRKNNRRNAGPTLTRNGLIQAIQRGRFGNEGFGVAGMVVPKHLEYLANLITPRDVPGARVPDPFVREMTATYQSKSVFNVTGVSGAGVAGSDNGRFCYVFNPLLCAANAAFSPINTVFQVAYKDIQTATGPWVPNFIVPSPGVTFDSYVMDNEQGSFFTSSLTGLVQRVRPVGMSVLASYSGQLINGGGNISAALVPGGSWSSHLTNGTAFYQIANWENLARIPGAYDGPLVSGAYAYWLPDDLEDTFLRTGDLSTANRNDLYEYPLIVVSGQVTSPTGAAIVTPSLRIECYINFEYTTDSRVVERGHGSRDLTELTDAVAVLSTQQTSMANGDHIDWIKVLIGGVAGFFLGGPVGAALGAAAGAGISLKYPA